MRQIFTLISCLAIFLISSAQSSKISIDTSLRIIYPKPSLKDRQANVFTATIPSDIINVHARRGCGNWSSFEKPLFVIDGMLADESEFKKLNPNSIESITILKSSEASALYGCRASQGVVIISTKTAYQRTIQVKDMLTGEPLIGSSVDIILIGAKRDTMHFVADSTGRVVIDKIIPGKDYQLRVSNTGYISFVSTINSKLVEKNHTVLLTSEFKTLEEVTIKAYKFSLKPNRFNCGCSSLDNILCGQLRCVIAGVKIIPESQQEMKSYQIHDFKIYPNPVLRSQKVNIEIIEENTEKLTLKLFGLSGNLISTNEYMVSKGINKLSYAIDAKIAAGIYIVQILDQKDRLIKTEKLIVQ